MVLWNFLHKKFPPSAQDKKNNPSTASGPPSFARKVKCFSYGIAPTYLIREENNFLDKVYSLFTTHLFILIRTFHVSLFTQSYFLFHTRHMNIITNIIIFCHRIIYIFLEYFFSTTDLQILQYRTIEFIR